MKSAKFDQAWQSIKSAVVEHLKGKAVTAALRAIFKTSTGSGFLMWVVEYLLKNFYDQVGGPILRALANRAGWGVYRISGGIILHKTRSARETKDEAAYNAAIDSLFK